MLSEFGIFCRKLRIDKDETLKDMADNLGITPSYLSLVETGRRNLPVKWSSLVVEHYQLDTEQEAELMTIFLLESLSDREIKILKRSLLALHSTDSVDHTSELSMVTKILLGELVGGDKPFVVGDWCKRLQIGS